MNIRLFSPGGGQAKQLMNVTLLLVMAFFMLGVCGMKLCGDAPRGQGAEPSCHNPPASPTQLSFSTKIPV